MTPAPSQQVGTCACEVSDAWRCAKRRNLTTISCPCECHHYLDRQQVPTGPEARPLAVGDVLQEGDESCPRNSIRWRRCAPSLIGKRILKGWIFKFRRPLAAPIAEQTGARVVPEIDPQTGERVIKHVVIDRKARTVTEYRPGDTIPPAASPTADETRYAPSEGEMLDWLAQLVGIETTTWGWVFVTTNGRINANSPEFRHAIQIGMRQGAAIADGMKLKP